MVPRQQGELNNSPSPTEALVENGDPRTTPSCTRKERISGICPHPITIKIFFSVMSEAKGHALCS